MERIMNGAAAWAANHNAERERLLWLLRDCLKPTASRLGARLKAAEKASVEGGCRIARQALLGALSCGILQNKRKSP